MESMRTNMQPPLVGENAGQILPQDDATSGEGLGASGRPRIDIGVENLVGGAAEEVNLDPSLQSVESQVVVTSSDSKILTEEGPARCVITTREGPLQPLEVERVEEEESCLALQERTDTCAEIQSWLSIPSISAVTSDFLGRDNRASASVYRGAHRFKEFKFWAPAHSHIGRFSLKQDVFIGSDNIREGGGKNKAPARVDIPFYWPGYRYNVWDPGGDGFIILVQRDSKREKTKAQARAEFFLQSPRARNTLWDPGGYIYFSIAVRRGGGRRQEKVPCRAFGILHPRGSIHRKFWDPGGYGSFILYALVVSAACIVGKYRVK